MQALRPLLYGYQGLRVWRTVELSRRPIVFATCRCKVQYRSKHDNHGPHKEYFQIPGQEPKPDLTPYVRPSQQQPSTSTSQPDPTSHRHNRSQHVDYEQTAPKPRGWLRVPRLVRSTIWFLLFLQLGAAAGTALITWEYLSPPFEPGSPEEEELIENVLETLEAHPMVQDLRDNKWNEVDAFTPDLSKGAKGRHMVHHVLGGNNTQGIFMKVFHHPQQEFTMMVFFFGFGVEGWPDVIHGGIISTMLQEGLHKHVAYYYPGYSMVPNYSTKIDFKKPCQPGEIYAVLVAPSANKAITSGNVHLTELQMTSLLCQLVGAPVINTEFDLASNTETHTVGIPAQKGHQPTHATCQASVKIVPKQIGQNGQAFEVGKQDDGAFARALEYLKTRPEFKNTNPTSSSVQPDEQEKDEDSEG